MDISKKTAFTHVSPMFLPQFAVLELKAILSVLVDTFQFDLRDPDFKVERRSAIVTRPLVIGEETDGNKLPLRVSLAPVDE